MANGLKYGTSNLTALMFDAPIINSSSVNASLTITNSEYNFLTEWVVNPEQPQDGIEVTEHTINIHKFKPNVWIIKSNYVNTSTKEAFLDKFYAKGWVLSNFADHASYLSSVSTYGSYKPIGLVLSPINSSNVLLTTAGGLDWPINQGCLKGPGVVGWSNYGFVSDGNLILYECSQYYINNGGSPDNLYNASYPQMALTVFTANETDNDGTISLIDTKTIVDPTTIEGYRATVGTSEVYNKEKSYANVIKRHGLEFEEHNSFTRSVDGKTVQILSQWNNQSTAFVVDTRGYESLYEHIRLPEVSGISSLISSSYPVKFWGKVERYSEYPSLWTSVQYAFANTDIVDGNFAQCLFANSKTNNPLTWTFTFDMPSDSNYINIGDMFACSSVASEIHFIINKGVIKSLHNAFLQTRNLIEITFNKVVGITDFSGAFEGTTLTNFPENVAPSYEWNGRSSEPNCLINYASDGSSLTHFGNYKDATAQAEDDKYYTLLLNPYCLAAFARNNISEIRYILDMKFVEPVSGMINYDGTIFNAIFGSLNSNTSSNLVTAKIKNLNKGNWYFDGTATNNAYAGKLDNLDADSVNYMLANVFDLTKNTTEASRFENEFNSLNDWVNSACTKRPILFEVWDNCTLTKNLSTSGTMHVILTLTNCKMKVNGTEYSAGTTSLPLSAGNCTISFEKINSNQTMYGVLQIDPEYVFKSELTPGLNSASIYLPSGFDSKINSAALSIANTRGWTVYVGGSIYTG